METTLARMELYDASEPQIRELVQEFGLNQVMLVARQYYGRWDEAWEALEANRQALQLSRTRNTR